MHTKISVAMATYNGELHLREQLNSIASQTVLPHEIVITDDCSTDQTIRVAEDFSSTVPFPVHIHRNDHNLGFANNFLKAASLCSGDWIAFSDQDDVWYSSKLHEVSAVIRSDVNRLLTMVCHKVDVVDAKLSPLGYQLPKFRRSRIKDRNSHFGFWHVGGAVLVFRASVLTEIDSIKRPPDDWLPTQVGFTGHPWLPHDKWICMLSNSLGQIAYIAEPLGAYRRHEATVTGSHADASIRERIHMADNTGATYYRSLANTARQTAEALRLIAEDITDLQRRTYLEETAVNFEALSLVEAHRAKLYETRGFVGRFKALTNTLTAGGYLGKPFCSLGLLSFAKDVTVTLTGVKSNHS